jgi:hypothetical protein
MCPVCLATLGFIAAGVTSTGGLAAWVVKGLPARRRAHAPDGRDPFVGSTCPEDLKVVHHDRHVVWNQHLQARPSLQSKAAASQALSGRRPRSRDSGCDEFDVPGTSNEVGGV